MDGHIYFHTGRKGYKLNGLNQTASFVVTEDLGMSYNGTHNFRSVQVLGTLKENCDYEIKKKIENHDVSISGLEVSATIDFGDDVVSTIDSNQAPYDYVEKGKLI